MQQPKVTIAIPTLNRADYLKLAIESSLAQTYENIEIVVSDNVSSDGTAELLRSYAGEPRIRVLSQPERLDMVGNWNACLAQASGDYFLMLSDDDLLEPEAIAALVEAFHHQSIPNEQIGIAYCAGTVIDETGKEIRKGPSCPPVEKAEDIFREFFNSRRMTWACSILFRREDVREGYTRDLPLLTDAAQWMQAVARHGFAVFVDRPLVRYRVHMNLSAKTPAEVWQKDNDALVERCVRLLHENGLGSEADVRAIRAAGARQRVHLVSQLINQRFAQRKTKGIWEYFRQCRHFLSPFGAFTFLTGSMELIAPKLLNSLIRARRKIPL